ncbi:MAG TPA: hypothetical protein VLF41_03030 [Candidatus Nanoarchaeia archaeon]|nr:hypothetical protein [Candidatus Nanoarchaeia archaeon]
MPQSLEVLTQQMLALNTPENPFTVQVQGNQVVATWNIVDAKWYQVFAKAGMKATYQLIVDLDPVKYEAKYTDKNYSIAWEGGLPKVGAEISTFQGKEFLVSSGAAYGIKDNMQPGEIYNFSFDTRKIKRPVFAVLDQCGWKLKGSFIDKLFG